MVIVKACDFNPDLISYRICACSRGAKTDGHMGDIPEVTVLNFFSTIALDSRVIMACGLGL